MPLTRHLATLGSALSLLLVITTGPSVAIPDDTCLSCHGSKDALADAGPRAPRLLVDAKALGGSVHDGFSCTQCHADLAPDNADIPHPTSLKPVDCGSCHAEIADTLKQTSVHAQSMQPREGAKSPCAQCHGNHQIRAAKDPESQTSAHKLADTCGNCHKAKTDGNDPVAQWKRSIHGRSAALWDVADAPTCAACHKPHEIRRVEDPANPLNRRNRMKVCGACHPSELKTVLRGVHGQAWQAGNLAAPVCSDCHGTHDVQRVHDRESRVYASQVSATCGKCHGDPDLTTRFGLRPDRVSTYENSFHGKGTRWKNANVANCASCHRYHDVRAGADPASPVNPKNLRATCGRPDCHPNATERFAQLPVHAGAASSGAGWLRMIRVSYVLIITLTLGFMAVHQAVELIALYRERRRRRKNGGAAHAAGPEPVPPPRLEPLTRLKQREGRWILERWTPSMIVQHVLLAITFTTLCFTGFALEIPVTWADRLGSFGPVLFNLRGILHRVAAVFMIGTSLYHAVWLVRTPRGRRELAEMLPRPIEDLQHALQNLMYFLGLRETAPAGSRYTYREKAEYWALVWGTFVMVATGVILWSAPNWPWMAVEISRVVHSYEAILAFGAILIWHMISVQFRPGMSEVNPTWIDGTVPLHVMLDEHGREYAEIAAWHGKDPATLVDDGHKSPAGGGHHA